MTQNMAEITHMSVSFTTIFQNMCRPRLNKTHLFISCVNIVTMLSTVTVSCG